MKGREMTDPEDILGVAASWLAGGECHVALATVVQSWGSSPRPAGSRMVVTRSGRMAGSVSGGCVEGAVVEAAQDALQTGKAKLLTYGVSDERAWEVGLPCGGQLSVFVERLSAAV